MDGNSSAILDQIIQHEQFDSFLSSIISVLLEGHIGFYGGVDSLNRGPRIGADCFMPAI